MAMDKHELNEYYGEPNIFQSKTWLEFQKSLGKKVWRLQTKEFTFLAVKNHLIFGKSYLYVPRGPIVHLPLGPEAFKVLSKELKEIAKKENIVFVRIEPPSTVPKVAKLIKKSGFSKATSRSPLSRQISPEHTLLLDLTLSEEKILSRMKQKGRYNIRVAEKHGVEVKESTNPKDIEIFLGLLSELEGRGQYSGHNPRHYEKMFQTLVKEGVGKLFIAYFEDRPINAIIVSYYGKVATYLHGASSSQNREVMAPYLTQWAAIKDAKKRDIHIYDFWGIAPEGATNHEWKGITDFKLRFGGEPISTIGAFDKPFQRIWYGFFKLANWFKKLGR